MYHGRWQKAKGRDSNRHERRDPHLDLDMRRPWRYWSKRKQLKGAWKSSDRCAQGVRGVYAQNEKLKADSTIVGK